MRDAKTVKLAYRPVTPAALEQFIALRRLETQGRPPADALKEVGMAADELARVSAAVNTFCQPRVLRVRLAKATAKSAEREVKQQQKLAEPIDDRDFVELYGQATWDLFKAQQDALVALRDASESLIRPR